MRLYDTASRGLKELPAPPGPVRMYFCGPTVYQRIHVGNARPFVLSMWLKRWLERNGYRVTLVENITDINDKIYAAAPGDSARLAEEASGWYVEDSGALGLGRPDREPKATESIPAIVSMIEELVASGHAYPAGGDVYFKVASFPDYGKLSGRHGDEEATRNPSEEAEEESLKDDPRDFALWKTHKEGEDTWWESPWGRGRPGWHIECSAMAEAHLGPVFEIHGGGLDLVFPHHENEVAQSRSLGHEFAQLWMHNGMLQLSGEKMSKSIGNIVSLRESLEEHGRETLLVYFLGGHWRKPLDYSDDVIGQAEAQVDSFRNVFRHEPATAPQGEWERFAEALNDDFNTPRALAVLNEWRNHRYLDLIQRGLDVFGLAFSRPHVIQPAGITSEEAFGEPKVNVQFLGNEPPEHIFQLAAERHEARGRRDFSTADDRRHQIEAEGFKIDDLPDGYVITPLDRLRHPKR